MTKRRKILTIFGVQAALFFGLMMTMLFFVGADWYWILMISLGYMGLGLMLSGLSFLYAQHVNKQAFEQKMKAGMEGEVIQTKVVEIDVPRYEGFDLSLEALKTLDNIPYPLPELKGLGFARTLNKLSNARLTLKIKESERSSGTIEARLKGKSFGFMNDPWDTFIIRIKIEAIDAYTSRVTIESRPRLPTVVFDFGLDLHFVNQIALFLRQESSRSARLEDLEAEDVKERAERQRQQLKVES
jgi:hypothetical protein